jgi:hypothetical protein
MAFKVALISALFSSTILTLIYWIMLRFTGSHASAFFTAALLIQAYSFLTQSVIIKFYPLNLLLIMLIFALTSRLYFFTGTEISHKSNNYLSGDKPLLLMAFLFGLVFANHHTGMLIAAPFFLIWGINHCRPLKNRFFPKSGHTIQPGLNCQTAINSSGLSRFAYKAFVLSALFISGFLINSYIIVRGGAGTYFNPSIWTSYKDLYELFFRQAYGAGGTISAASSLLSGLDIYLSGAKNLYVAIITNFSVYSLPLFVAGCVYFIRINAGILLFLMTCLLLYGPFLARVSLGSPDISELNYYMGAHQYFLPEYAFYAIFTGAGFYQIIQWLKRFRLKLLSRVLPIIFACFPLVFLVQRAVDSNYRTDYVPHQLANDSYSILPISSVFIAFGDNANYQGWYLKTAGRFREDICHLTSGDQKSMKWGFQGCSSSVYMPSLPMIFSGDFDQMVPLMLKGRLLGTDPIKDNTIYANFLRSNAYSLNYLYLPRNIYMKGAKVRPADILPQYDQKLLDADNFMHYSVCLSHFTDDLFTRQSCSHYTSHLAGMAQYYSAPIYKKTGGKISLRLINADTGDSQIMYSIDITERNLPYVKLIYHIGEFNRWKSLYLRRDE